MRCTDFIEKLDVAVAFFFPSLIFKRRRRRCQKFLTISSSAFWENGIGEPLTDRQFRFAKLLNGRQDRYGRLLSIDSAWCLLGKSRVLIDCSSLNQSSDSTDCSDYSEWETTGRRGNSRHRACPGGLTAFALQNSTREISSTSAKARGQPPRGRWGFKSVASMKLTFLDDDITHHRFVTILKNQNARALQNGSLFLGFGTVRRAVDGNQRLVSKAFENRGRGFSGNFV